MQCIYKPIQRLKSVGLYIPNTKMITDQVYFFSKLWGLSLWVGDFQPALYYVLRWSKLGKYWNFKT